MTRAPPSPSRTRRRARRPWSVPPTVAHRHDVVRSPPMSVPRERHPWNTGFEWREHAGPFTTITAEQARAYDREGFFVFEHAYDDATLHAIDDAIQPGEQRARTFLADQPD